MQSIYYRMPGLLLVVAYCCLQQSCTRNEIIFGTLPEDTYTEIVQVDTVSVNLSTVFPDSIATNNVSNIILGRYRDPHLGTYSGRVFSQITIPASIPEIPTSAVFDSLVLVLHTNHYYYGDTSSLLRFTVHELDQTIAHSYGSFLYNTSDIALRQPALGEALMAIRPAATDSVLIRLADAMGADLLDKLRINSPEISSESDFLNFFKGISVGVAAGDIGAIYGFDSEAGSISIQLHYHTVFPYKEPHIVSFNNIQNDLQFNQILHDRTGTGLISSGGANTEIFSTATNNRAMMQTGLGIKLKASFPGLRGLLQDKELIKLLKAELILRPAYLSFDNGGYRLPGQVYLIATDATNLDGNMVFDSTGSSILYADPVLDPIYGENTHYRFNVTKNINALLLTPGSEQSGFFFQHEDTMANLSRLLVDDRFSGKKTAELRLSILIINK